MYDDAWGDLDWLSEEKYNVLKEKYNNMPKKKKKKGKKKKAKSKKKKKKIVRMWNPNQMYVLGMVVFLLFALYCLSLIPH